MIRLGLAWAAARNSISRNKGQQQQQPQQELKSGRTFIYLDASLRLSLLLLPLRFFNSGAFCCLHCGVISALSALLPYFTYLISLASLFPFFSFLDCIRQSAADKRTRCELLPFLHWGPLKYFSCKGLDADLAASRFRCMQSRGRGRAEGISPIPGRFAPLITLRIRRAVVVFTFRGGL